MQPAIREGRRRAQHTLSSWGRFSAAKAGCFAFSAGGMSTVSSTLGADAGAASRLRAATGPSPRHASTVTKDSRVLRHWMRM